MLHNITEFARKSRAMPRDAEPEVVAAISSAEGRTNLSHGGAHRGVGVALPLLALAIGVALGYGGIRWLQSSPSRRLPREAWQRLADAARPFVEAGKARLSTLR